MSTGHRRHDVEIDVPVGTISRTQGRMLDSSFTFRNEADCRDHVAGLHRNYPAMAEFLASHIDMTFEEKAA